MSLLKNKLEEIIPKFREEVGEIRKNHGDKKLCDVTVAQAYGGMRGVKVMITETSANIVPASSNCGNILLLNRNY